MHVIRSGSKVVFGSLSLLFAGLLIMYLITGVNPNKAALRTKSGEKAAVGCLNENSRVQISNLSTSRALKTLHLAQG